MNPRRGISAVVNLERDAFVMDDASAAMARWIQWCGVFLLGVVTFLSTGTNQSWALVVSSRTSNSSAPSDNPGWGNVVDIGSAVYLGDSWVIAADHAIADSGTNGLYTKLFRFGGLDYEVIPGSSHKPENPNYMADGMPQITDLQMFRIKGKPNLEPLGIAESSVPGEPAVPVGGDVVMIGGGRKENSLSYEWLANTNTWAWSSPYTSGCSNCNFSGFKANILTKRWGANTVINPNAETGLANTVLSAYEADIDEDGFLDFERNDANHSVFLRSLGIVGLMLRFDEVGIDINQDGNSDEAIAGAGDSGGAVFYRNGENWELAGLMHAVMTYPKNSPETYAYWGSYRMYGNYTIMSDLSVYRGSDADTCVGVGDCTVTMKSIMNDFRAYSDLGDLDLDGEVTGYVDPLGVATGDLAMFVAGWMYDHDDGQLPGQGDIISWQHGDLNFDAKTNFADFLLMREALGGSFSAGQLFSLLGNVTVPEPTTLVLALAGGVFLKRLAMRRRNR